jgi:putative ABC transport system ATP-binding protein
MLSAVKLSKTYYGNGVETPVLHNINLDIGEGEFLSIIGPSGAGKSTLLYQLSLLDRPTEGSVSLDGAIVSTLSEAQATRFRLINFGFIFQDYALVPELTALENVLAPSLMEGAAYGKAKKDAMAALERLGIAKKAKNLPSQLSGGEQQRVAIARAVSRQPRILFADEPTANLDSANSAEVLDELEELHAAGQTIVMITHEMEYAARAKRIVTIQDGRVVSDKMKGKA